MTLFHVGVGKEACLLPCHSVTLTEKVRSELPAGAPPIEAQEQYADLRNCTEEIYFFS